MKHVDDLYVGKHRGTVVLAKNLTRYIGKHRHIPSKTLPICVVCFKRIS